MEVKWIERKEKKILLIDYTGIIMEKQLISHLQSALVLIEEVPKGENLYILTDLTGCFATPGFLEASKKVEKEVLTQYKLKWAIMGISGPKVILLRGFNLLAKTKLEPFDSREAALNYLSAD
jgi:hypothetical protein